MSTYSYKNPKFINSPKGVVEVVEVIYDGKDDPAYSLAIIKWENTYKLGIRWNIAYSVKIRNFQISHQSSCLLFY